MNHLRRIKERWSVIKAIVTSGEYYVCVSDKKDNNEFGSISYQYFTNSDRKIFFKFVEDDITERIENHI